MGMIEQIRAELDAATPGPWECWDDPTGVGWGIARPEEVAGELGDSSQFVGSADEEADAQLIAHAPAYLAALLDVAEAAERHLWAVDHLLGLGKTEWRTQDELDTSINLANALTALGKIPQ